MMMQGQLDAAGNIVKLLRQIGTPEEAQHTLALVAAHMCMEYEIQPELFGAVVADNTRRVIEDPILANRLQERVSRIAYENTRLAVVPDFLGA